MSLNPLLFNRYGSYAAQGEAREPPRGMRSPDWEPRWDDYKPTNNTYGGYMPPKKGDWEFAGMVERTRPATYNAGAYIQMLNPTLPPYKTGEMVPFWRRAKEEPAAPAQTSSYAGSGSSAATLEELASRREALERSQEYARQAMSQAGRTGGNSEASSSSSTSSGSPVTPPTGSNATAPTATATTTTPSSGTGSSMFSDWDESGRSYVAAAQAARARDEELARMGVSEAAYASQRLLDNTDPSMYKLSKPMTAGDIRDQVKKYKKILA